MSGLVKFNRDIVCIAAAGLCLTAASLLLLSRQEPLHEGRGLSSWLEDFHAGNARACERAGEAVRAMGTNTLPHLLTLLSDSQPGLQDRMAEVSGQQSFLGLEFETSFGRQWEALRGFRALGEEARPALPRLAELLETSDQPQFVTFALAEIGPESLPVLTGALTNENQWVRRGAAAAIGLLGRDAEDAVPALAERLDDSCAAVRKNAALTLGSLGELAESAIPSLIPRLNDSDWTVSRAAAMALRMIDPELAASPRN